jgi:hypothetical protein
LIDVLTGSHGHGRHAPGLDLTGDQNALLCADKKQKWLITVRTILLTYQIALLATSYTEETIMLIFRQPIPRPEGPPWKQKIVVIENATEEPIDIRIRYTNDPYLDVKSSSWRIAGPFEIAPGTQCSLLKYGDETIAAAKACVRFEGKMTKRRNVPPASKDKTEFYGPQIVVCGAPYDTPEMAEWTYTCKF